jgi:hypothetical protein
VCSDLGKLNLTAQMWHILGNAMQLFLFDTPALTFPSVTCFP